MILTGFYLEITDYRESKYKYITLFSDFYFKQLWKPCIIFFSLHPCVLFVDLLHQIWFKYIKFVVVMDQTVLNIQGAWILSFYTVKQILDSSFPLQILFLKNYLLGHWLTNACLLTRWKCTRRCVYVCGWEEQRGEGNSLYFICSAHWLQPCTFILSLLFVAYFLSFLFPSLTICTFVLPHGLVSDIHAVLAHNLVHSGSSSLHSRIPLLCSLLSVFLLWIWDFGGCSAFIPPFWSLRQQSASDWGGFFF